MDPDFVLTQFDSRGTDAPPTTLRWLHWSYSHYLYHLVQSKDLCNRCHPPTLLFDWKLLCLKRWAP